MRLKLHSNWRLLIRKAWSFRFMALAGLFSTAEAILPLYTDQFPRGLFSVLTGLSIIGGMVSRLFIQKDTHGNKAKN